MGSIQCEIIEMTATSNPPFSISNALSPAKQAVHWLGGFYNRHLCRADFENQTFDRINERAIEYRFVFDNLIGLRPKSILDVGTGQSALPQLMRSCGHIVTASDNIGAYWPRGMVNRFFHIIQDDITRTRLSGPYDLLTCISVLEHIPEFDAAISSMFRLIKQGGHLILTCPYSESQYVKNCYDLPSSIYGRGSPYICQSFSRNQLASWCDSNTASIVRQEYWRLFTGEHWTEGAELPAPLSASNDTPHQLTCLLLRKDG